MMPPTMQPIAQPLPEAGDGGRRGKPKRRRFNFNVLENLEKMVQPRAPEAGMAPMQSMPPAPSAPITDSAATLPTAPAAPPVMPALTPQGATLTPPPVETPSLPFLFGKRGGAGAGAEAPASQPAEATVPPAEENAVAPETPVPPSEPAATFAPSSPPEAPSEPKVDARRSMRSMMFGEEIAAAPVTRAGVPDAGPGSQPEAAESTADFGAEPKDSGDFTDSTTAEPKADDATSAETETSWSSWSRSDQASSAIADESSSASEAPADAGADAEPSEERTSAFDAYEPWKPSTASEPAASSTTETESWRTSGDQATEAPAEPVTTEEVPVASAEPSEVSAPETPGTSSGGEAAGPSAGTLVIIEDDQTAASYYATLFRGNGYHVEVANDGVSGVDLCARVQPQVILLDVMMPRQNGILVLQTLRASDETKNTPVVVMSNFSEPTLIKRALQLGALEYVIKTQVEGPALLNAVPRWVNREKAFSPA
jgi:CheY-like chemotaxis protein